MLFTNTIYAHTAITGIDKAGTEMLQMKYRASVGDKFRHYALLNQSDVMASGMTAGNVDSKSNSLGKFVLEGFYKDNADLLPGYTPPVTAELMSVTPGESIQVLWPTNGHLGSKEPIRFHYRPEYPNTKPVTLKDYFSDFPENPQNSVKYMFDSTPYPQDAKDTTVKCQDNIPDPGFTKAVGPYNVPIHQLCTRAITLPTTLKPGLQRIVMSWYADFNPIMFFDLIYVKVGEGSDNTTTSTNTTEPLVTYSPPIVPASTTSSIVDPAASTIVESKYERRCKANKK